jgi:cell division protein FtsA
MSGDGKLVVGLDLGTTKICTVIAEVAADRGPRVLGVGSCPSQGLRRGVVTDVEKTVQAVEKAIHQAELMAGVEVQEVFAGIAGEHVSSLNSSGVVAIAGEDGRITEEDRRRVLESAGAVNIPIDREILHVLPQEFVVDGRRDIADPVGMFGVRLEAHVHVVTGAVTAAQNICRSILRAGLEVRDIALEPLASCAAVLNADERQMGICLVDVGGGTTDIAVFTRGGIRYTGVIGLGGQNVTSDVAIGLRTSWPTAEKIKCTWGTASLHQVGEDEVVEVPGVAGRPAQQTSRRLLADIIEARMEEIFILVREQLGAVRFELAAGIVLTGGGALIDGAVELAERVFEVPVRLGVPRGVTGMVEGVESPAYATALGLARLAGERGARDGEQWLKRENLDEDGFEAVFGRMKEWFQTWV